MARRHRQRERVGHGRSQRIRIYALPLPDRQRDARGAGTSQGVPRSVSDAGARADWSGPCAGDYRRPRAGARSVATASSRHTVRSGRVPEGCATPPGGGAKERRCPVRTGRARQRGGLARLGHTELRPARVTTFVCDTAVPRPHPEAGPRRVNRCGSSARRVLPPKHASRPGRRAGARPRARPGGMPTNR